MPTLLTTEPLISMHNHHIQLKKHIGSFQIQTQTTKARLKQVGKNGILIVEKIKSMSELWEFLSRMEASIE